MSPAALELASFRSSAYRRYALVALTAAYTLSLLDQSLITLVLEPIKKDLGASDSELGLLTGIAFGLLYATAGLPVGRWADSSSRVRLTAAAIALWGATVMLPIFTRSFAQLAGARMAVSIGSAACMPPSYSLVGDYFPRAAERARALAIYMLANPLSYLLGFGVGGWLNDHYGWRLAFVAIGLPGIALAVLIATTLKETRTLPPVPGDHLSSDGEPSRRVGLIDVAWVIWRQHTMRHIVFALVIVYILGLGTLPWYGAFMMRAHGMRTVELGVWFALIFGGGGMAGALMGGYAAAKWWANDERRQLCAVAVSIALLIPCFALFLLLRDEMQSLLALTVLMVVWNMYLGPVFALLQRLVPGEIRASTLALVMLAGNLIGMGIGPLLVGTLSDGLRPLAGQHSLRDALLCVSMLSAGAAYYFWQASLTVMQDLSAVRSQTPATELAVSRAVP